MERKPPERPDVSEHGGMRGGQPQTSDRRLFMQLLAFGGCDSSGALCEALSKAKLAGVLYEDVTDPRGVALLTMAEDPSFFVTTLRRFLHDSAFADLTPKPELTMFGRTYALGYEPDLEDTLFGRPRRTALNKAWPWAVWYPLRRTGAFSQLPPHEQRDILMEHGSIGMAFGGHDLAHDIRLACFGLDRHDNDFVVGLVGKDLHPLSAVVQTMRKTRQTSMFIEKLGPFFIGRAAWQSACAPETKAR